MDYNGLNGLGGLKYSSRRGAGQPRCVHVAVSEAAGLQVLTSKSPTSEEKDEGAFGRGSAPRVKSLRFRVCRSKNVQCKESSGEVQKSPILQESNKSCHLVSQVTPCAAVRVNMANMRVKKETGTAKYFA